MRSVLSVCIWVVLVLAMGIPASSGLSAQTPAEQIYAGVFDFSGIKLRFVLHLTKNSDGTYSATADSPDQGAKGIPVKKVTLTDGKLNLDIAAVQGVFEGRQSADGTEIAGTWEQGGVKIPITLKKVDKAPETIAFRRPQNPKKPYTYAEREVRYDNLAAGIKLAGTLTIPPGKGPFPAVLLITGSGAQNRDEELLGHKPFLILSDYLTRRGIAVLRVDDRGVGGSTGSMFTSTTDDFVGDVLSGVAYLKTCKEIDPKRIGLCGHSEGGLIAPMAAARSQDVAFIVLMAGTGIPGDQLLKLQEAAVMHAMEVPEEQIKRIVALNSRLFKFVLQDKGDADSEKKLQSLMEEIRAGLSEKERKQVEATGALSLASMKQVRAPWFRNFLALDPRIALRRVKCPVLAINGEKDVQVPPKDNLPEIAGALKAAGNKDVTIRELPSLNHLFQTCKTGAPTEYAQIEETISPVALRAIGDWIVNHTTPRARK